MSLPKDPKDMNLQELRMLLEVRKLELQIQAQDVRHKLGLTSRIFKAIKSSGVLESFAEIFQEFTSRPSRPKREGPEPGFEPESKSESPGKRPPAKKKPSRKRKSP
jgi:hypothetical protein